MARRGRWLPLREAVAALADEGVYFHCNPAFGIVLFERNGEMTEMREKSVHGETRYYVPAFDDHDQERKESV